MLEQSHVVIAGVVFNGLTDDMNNWSSYGYGPITPAIEDSSWGRQGRGAAGATSKRAMRTPWRWPDRSKPNLPA